MPTTTFGVRYPDPTEPVAEGAARIRDVAEALDSRVLAGRIDWGAAGAAADVALYRAGVDQLRTDDQLVVAYADQYGHAAVIYGALTLLGGTPAKEAIYFGAAADVSIYRGGADLLKTDDNFQAWSVTAGGPIIAGADVSVGGRVHGGAGGNAAELSTRSGGNGITFEWDGTYLWAYVDETPIRISD